jgi:hypothetical protein
MTVELFSDTPSGIELLIAWLVPLKDIDGRDVGPAKDILDGVPFSMVSIVGGSDDKITDHGIYQIDDYAATLELVEAQARLTRRRMLALGPPLAPQRRVTISTGVAYADSVTTSVSPHWLSYGDNTKIQRFVSRYAVDLRMVAV